MELCKLGKVVKLHGYLGLMKIATTYDKDFDLKKLDYLYDEKGNEFKVNRVFTNTGAIVVGLDGVDLEKAKTYIGSWWFVDRKLLSGKILFEDLKESVVVFEDETEIGKIVDVQDFGTAEVITVKTGDGKEMMFPRVPDLIVSFDYKTKKLVVSKDKFKEVADYEDWYFDTLSWNVWTTQTKHFEKGNR